MNKHLSRNAFTLVELLVVITIIGILAGIALPVFQKVQVNAEQTKILANGKQIGLACKLFAGDHDGAFPSKLNEDTNTPTTAADANDCLGNLIPQYVPQERLFWVKGSAFCKTTPPDENTSGTSKLAGGENNFAYVAGSTDQSTGSWPLLADGFNAGATNAVGAGGTPTYINDKTKIGGVWEGNKAIVIRIDQSGSVATCNKNVLTATFVPRDDDRTQNLFTYAANTAGGTGPAWLDSTKSGIYNPKAQ